VLHSDAGRLAAAIANFDQAILLDPEYAEAYNNRGVVWQAQGDLAAARNDYEKAIKLRKRYPGALTNRAYLRQLDHDYPGAIEDYASALRMAPDAHPTLNDLAWLLATCPDENIRDGKSALTYAERANQLTDNKDPDYLDTLAAAAAEAGDFDRAVSAAESAIKLAPEDTRAEISARLELYRKKETYTEQSAGPALETPAEPQTESETKATPDSK
jgi:Flp pilus assembly protein TadD